MVFSVRQNVAGKERLALCITGRSAATDAARVAGGTYPPGSRHRQPQVVLPSSAIPHLPWGPVNVPRTLGPLGGTCPGMGRTNREQTRNAEQGENKQGTARYPATSLGHR